ncbi:unnamed protein product [Prorocentrum cordatum]|uniref:Uncharacterized protein n=1 Tax=Prorocentrum cordatum TaxID=2364126 RepID=A0ABN9XXF8_9DINO|nr:unnamed protein product [Polarella glacialis]
MVPYTVIYLVSLTVFAAIGRRAFERQERQLFAGFLAEKQMRFQAEFQLSRVTRSEAVRAEDLGSDRSAPSRPGTTMSAAAFNSTLPGRRGTRVAGPGPRHWPPRAVADRGRRAGALAQQGARRGWVRHRPSGVLPQHTGGCEGAEGERR